MKNTSIMKQLAILFAAMLLLLSCKSEEEKKCEQAFDEFVAQILVNDISKAFANATPKDLHYLSYKIEGLVTVGDSLNILHEEVEKAYDRNYTHAIENHRQWENANQEWEKGYLEKASENLRKLNNMEKNIDLKCKEYLPQNEYEKYQQYLKMDKNTPLINIVRVKFNFRKNEEWALLRYNSDLSKIVSREESSVFFLGKNPFKRMLR